MRGVCGRFPGLRCVLAAEVVYEEVSVEPLL
eukprot:SAG11_NODE_19874_length_457_cov_0.986034_1_plen_30_part_10